MGLGYDPLKLGEMMNFPPKATFLDVALQMRAVLAWSYIHILRLLLEFPISVVNLAEHA